MSEQFFISKSLLNKATSPDQTPTPGYLYDELAKVTNDDMINARLIEYLVFRLKNKNPDTKKKVLTIIRHVCMKGNNNFRREWNRNVALIKEHLLFKGPSDPLRGDSPSKEVREAAKLALEAIFSSTNDNMRSKNAAKSALQSRITGIGNTVPTQSNNNNNSYNNNTNNNRNYDLSPSRNNFKAQSRYSNSNSYNNNNNNNNNNSSNNNKPRFEGIGNPNFKDPRNQPKTFMNRVTDKVKQEVQKYAHEVQIQKNNKLPGVNGNKPSWMQNSVDGYNYANNIYGNTKTGTYNPTSLNNNNNNNNNVNYWSNTSSNTSSNNNSNRDDPRSPRLKNINNDDFNNQKSDGTYERQLISELTQPGGVKPIPPQEKLKDFCIACKMFAPSVVMPIINEKLDPEANNWKVQHKALVVLQELFKTKGCETYADWLDENPAYIDSLLLSKQNQVKERAKKVWKLIYEQEDVNAYIKMLNGDTDVGSSNNNNSNDVNNNNNDTTEVNLLDFDDDSQLTDSTNNNNNYNQITIESTPNQPGSLLDFISNPNSNTNKVNNNNNESKGLFSNMKVKSKDTTSSTNIANSNNNNNNTNSNTNVNNSTTTTSGFSFLSNNNNSTNNNNNSTNDNNNNNNLINILDENKNKIDTITSAFNQTLKPQQNNNNMMMMNNQFNSLNINNQQQQQQLFMMQQQMNNMNNNLMVNNNTNNMMMNLNLPQSNNININNNNNLTMNKTKINTKQQQNKKKDEFSFIQDELNKF